MEEWAWVCESGGRENKDGSAWGLGRRWV